MRRFVKTMLLLGVISFNIIGGVFAMQNDTNTINQSPDTINPNPNTINNELIYKNANNSLCNVSLDKVKKCFQSKPYGLTAKWTGDGTFLTIMNAKKEPLLKFHKSGNIPTDAEL